QISGNILQVENEYYGLIRPKRVTRSGEMPSRALKRRGVEYVELRALDVSLADPAGINQNQMRFIEAFLIYCLIEDSPSLTAREIAEAESNQLLVARQGREPGLTLGRHAKQILLTDWADEICVHLVGICELLDEGSGSSLYREALELQREAIRDPDLTPSARILAEMKRSGESFFSIAQRISEQHREYFLSLGENESARLEFLSAEAVASIGRQKEIEAGDRLSFEAYLHNYFSQAEQLI
ncbi:MAG: glutamate--cysteine ligase, partial [Lysobacterales bacterium]